MENLEFENYLSLNVVSQYTGISAQTILEIAEAGSFPSSVQYDDDKVWFSSDIANWIEAQPICLSFTEGRKAA